MSLTKPYQSPFQVTYDDLVEAAENRLRVLIATIKPGWKGTHEIEVQKKLVAILKKFKKYPQVDLFEEFKKIK